MLMLGLTAVTLPALSVAGGGAPVALPEASSLALLIMGLAAVSIAARRRRARPAVKADPPPPSPDTLGGSAAPQ